MPNNNPRLMVRLPYRFVLAITLVAACGCAKLAAMRGATMRNPLAQHEGF
jgi:hypothetical protein